MQQALKTLYQRFAARRVFSRWATSYEADVARHRYSAAQAVAQAVAPYLEPESRVLDLGIGTGLIWQDLEIPESAEISGIDISADMLVQASSNPDIGSLFLCDAGREIWPVEGGYLDAVVSGGLFEYLTQTMAKHVFKEAARTLRAGGLFITTYIPAEINMARLWKGQSGNILSCRYAPEWLENQPGFRVVQHTAPFPGSVFSDCSSYDYRLIMLERV
jgi:predicted TPR repeat methyltransferase